jgi:hypothetical protein
VRGALNAAYQHTYATAPREFFNQYRVAGQGANRLRDAVKLTAGVLFTGQGRSLASAVSTNSVANDLTSRYLVQKWGMLSGEYIFQRPTDHRVARAWDMLEQKFKPGCKEILVAKPLVELLNAPHGYDYNTVTLLFAAWYGFHHQDLELRQSGRLVKHAALSNLLQKGSKDFLQNLKLQNVSLSRRNPDDARKEVRAIIQRPSTSLFTEDEADSAIVILESFAVDERNNEREREEAREKAQRIRAALETGKKYKEQAAYIQRQIDNRANIRGLLDAAKVMNQLPRLSLIAFNAPEPAEIQAAIHKALEQTVNEECQQLALPNDVTQVGLYEQRLNAMCQELVTAKFGEFEKRIQAATRELHENAEEMRKRQSENAIRAEIRSISSSASLSELMEKVKHLYHLSGYSADVMALRDQKMGQLNNEIERLNTRLQSLDVSIDSADTIQKVDVLRDELLQATIRYRDSDYQEVVENAVKRLTRLQEFLRATEEINRISFQSLVDVERAQTRVGETRQIFAEVLGTSHLAILDRARTDFEKQVSAEQEKALSWLRRCREEVQNGQNALGILRKLDNPPDFLPSERMPEVKQLRLEVQERLDNDAILRIETTFREITDPERQRECLQRLTRLMEQPSAVGRVS